MDNIFFFQYDHQNKKKKKSMSATAGSIYTSGTARGFKNVANRGGGANPKLPYNVAPAHGGTVMTNNNNKRSAFNDVTNRIKAPQPAFDPKLLPIASMSFSDFVGQEQERRLLKQNPDQTIPHYKENKEIYWNSFADWAAENVGQMKTIIFQYMANQKHWIFNLFPIVLSNKTKFQQITVEYLQHISEIGVRKVPFREIGMTKTVRMKEAVYTAQGFSMDYHIMKTPEGRVAWDRLVDGITSNLWTFIITQCLHEMIHSPDAYKDVKNLYPAGEIPRNVREYFRNEESTAFLLNKKGTGAYDVVTHASKVMNQRNANCTGLIVDRRTMFYMHGRNPMNLYQDYSGPLVLSQREKIGYEQTAAGVKLYPVPLGQKAHDNEFSDLLQFETQRGSFWKFREVTNYPAGKSYESSHRNIRFFSATLNGMKEYSIKKAIDNIPEFYPLGFKMNDDDDEEEYNDDIDYMCMDDDNFFENGVDPSHNPRGALNRPLLWGLIDDRDTVFHDRMQTKLEGNEEDVNVFVHFNRESTPGKAYTQDQQYYPINCIGELSRKSMNPSRMHLVAESLIPTMMAGISKEDYGKIERGLRLAEGLNTMEDFRIVAYSSFWNKNYIGYTSAHANLENRIPSQDTNPQQTDDFLGTIMTSPNIYGGPEFDIEKLTTDLARSNWIPLIPTGLGNISGFMTVLDLSQKVPNNGNLFDPTIYNTIVEFVPLFKQMVQNLRTVCPRHPGLNPRMIPLYHNSKQMSNDTRIMIAAWYSIFAYFVPGNVVTVLKTKHNTSTMRPLTDADYHYTTPISMEGYKASNALTPDEPHIQPQVSAAVLQKMSEIGENAKRVINEIISSLPPKSGKLPLTSGNKELFLFLSKLANSSNFDTLAKRLEQEARQPISTATKPILESINQIINSIFGGSLQVFDHAKAIKFITYLQTEKEVVTLLLQQDHDGTASTAASILSQFTIQISKERMVNFVDDKTKDSLHFVMKVPVLVPKYEQTSPTLIKHIAGVDKTTTDKTLDMPFELTDKNMWGGTIYTALPFVHPSLPLIGRSGDISESVAQYPNIARMMTRKPRPAMMRNGFPAITHTNFYSKQMFEFMHEKAYTQQYELDLRSHSLMQKYPSFVAHIAAHPPCNFANTEVSEMEMYVMMSHAVPTIEGIAIRALIYLPICNQSLTDLYRNDVRLMFNFGAIRQNETFITNAGIAIDDGVIGQTNFSGFDNTVSFDAHIQHYRVQAFLWVAAMVTNATKFYVIPHLHGGNNLGGTGHLGIDEDATVPIQDNMELRETISSCDGKTLGARSIIFTIGPYEAAFDDKYPVFQDVRNNFNESDFPYGLVLPELTNRRVTLSDGAFPVLNYLFDWNKHIPALPPRNQNFAQRMRREAVNFWIAEGVTDVYNPQKNGWERRPGHGIWGNLQIENGKDIQSSKSSVVNLLTT